MAELYLSNLFCKSWELPSLRGVARQRRKVAPSTWSNTIERVINFCAWQTQYVVMGLAETTSYCGKSFAKGLGNFATKLDACAKAFKY